jgi:cobalt transporter subunit CbtA
MFRQIVWTALIVGAVVGVMVTLVQSLYVVPLIEQAVALESSVPSHPMISTLSEGHNQPADFNAHVDQNRWLYTGLSNIMSAMGFALLLTAAMSLVTPVNWQRGMLWGLAGYTVFFVAPSLGLPPELPGSWQAALGERQLWWAITVVLTTVGLGMATFSESFWLKGLGIIPLILPHVVGAPLLAVDGGTVPELMNHEFLIATAITSLIFWLAIGTLNGWIYPKLTKVS